MRAVFAAQTNREDPLAGLEIGDRPEPDPPGGWTTVAVRKVEIANTAEFKRIVRGFLLMSKVLDTPSRADITTAAAPP